MNRWLVVTGVGLLVVSLAGCNATKRELTVVFATGSTTAQHQAALRTCTGVAPHTSPEPMSTDARFAATNVRFRIDQASDRDIAKLEECLGREAGVKGFQDSADN